MPSVNPGPAASSSTNVTATLNVPPVTFAALPPANSVPANTPVVTTDMGPAISNGSAWVLLNQVGASFPYVTNLKRTNTNRWRAARGKVMAGVSNARLLCVGNSITAGEFATGSASGNNLASKSYPTQLAQLMTAQGLNSSWQSWIGGQNFTDFNAADSRIVMGGWVNGGLGTFGGNSLLLPQLTGPLMSFTPTTQVDTVILLGVRSQHSTVNVAVDGGGTLTTFDPFTGASGAISISTPIALGSLGSHAIQLSAPTAANNIFMDGMIAYNSAVPEVTVLRGGWIGALISAFNSSTSTWPYTDGVKAVAPDLSLIAVTRNDCTNGTPIASFIGNYQILINACIASGDVILVIEPMGNVAPAIYAQYVQAVYALAASNNCPVVDFTLLWDLYGSITNWYADGIHPNGFGYADMARSLCEVALSI